MGKIIFQCALLSGCLYNKYKGVRNSLKKYLGNLYRVNILSYCRVYLFFSIIFIGFCSLDIVKVLWLRLSYAESLIYINTLLLSIEGCIHVVSPGL